MKILGFGFGGLFFVVCVTVFLGVPEMRSNLFPHLLVQDLCHLWPFVVHHVGRLEKIAMSKPFSKKGEILAG